MRRNTLSALSPAQLNSRIGLGRGNNDYGSVKRMGPGFGFGSAMSRPMSLAPGALDGTPSALARRSSIYGVGKGQQAKNDPRAVNDKQLQQAHVRVLINYLSQHGYDHPLTPKDLASPTNKEFIHLVQFLLRKTDPNLKIAGKVEDEVPVLFKQLGYPFPISKSALYAVGSPHAWPALLAAVVWLVELLEYEEKAEELKEESSYEDELLEKEFDDYMERVYQFYLLGDDENCFLMDQHINQRYQDIQQELKTKSEQLMQANMMLQAELEVVQAEPTPMQVMELHLSDHRKDVERISRLLVYLKDTKNTLAGKMEEHERALASTQSELADVRSVVDTLKEKLAVQQIKQADIDHLSQERSRLKESIQSVTTKREALQKALWDREVFVSRKLEDVEEAVSLFRAAGQRLDAIPATAQRANGVVYDINLNPRGSNPEEVLGKDLKTIIKPALVQLDERLSKQISEVEHEECTLKEQLATSEVLKAEEQAAVFMMEVELKQLESDYKSEKQKFEDECALYELEVDRITASIDKLFVNSTRALREQEERHEIASATYKKVEEECHRAAKKLESDVMEAAEMLKSHKLYVEQSLSDLRSKVSHAENKMDEVILVRVDL